MLCGGGRGYLRREPHDDSASEAARSQCCRILDKNSCARSLRGLPKNSAVGASSTISPLSMNTTRWATLRAKPISWVTTIMVMPSVASDTITSSTSLIISGSSAEVGSSNSMAIGSIASARAIATRCCCPPESSPGYFLAWAVRPTRSSRRMPRCLLSSSPRPSTLICAISGLRITVRCGNSSKCWNTMPMRARSLGRSVLGSPTEVPETVMVPSWNGSSPLTHLISVDLPDPEGPHTTTTSPLATSVEQSFRTWKSWYHLLTLLSVIMGVTVPNQVLTDDCDPALQPAHEQRGAVGDHEIDQRREQVHLH